MKIEITMTADELKSMQDKGGEKSIVVTLSEAEIKELSHSDITQKDIIVRVLEG